jgi:hypothetical protein
MIKVEFIALDRQKAVRKALDYWYKNFYGHCTMLDFVHKCTWKKDGRDYFVIYRGPKPPKKDKK